MSELSSVQFWISVCETALKRILEAHQAAAPPPAQIVEGVSTLHTEADCLPNAQRFEGQDR